MKTSLFVLLLLATQAISDGKKFEVTFTVTYNAISLEDAAKKEAVFRELYKDACKVDVTVREGMTEGNIWQGAVFNSIGGRPLIFGRYNTFEIGSDTVVTK
jgi:hypothetical protein